MRSLVLASASPRRRDLLNQVGFEFKVLPADIDETPRPDELPLAYVERMAKEKAMVVGKVQDQAVVLAADTIVVLGENILGKANSPADARDMVASLSGRKHRVSTAIAVFDNTKLATQVVTTEVEFIRCADTWIDAYIGTGEWRGKAGSYAIQGIGAAMVKGVIGSVTSVIGLPLAETIALLKPSGITPILSKGVAV